jgi:hypothetical protein
MIDTSFIILANRILAKVKEFIEEKNAMDPDTYILIDKETWEVRLGTAADEDPGEKLPIVEFMQEVNGKIYPDWDLIDTFAASWR